jgi:hypothetical protein
MKLINLVPGKHVNKTSINEEEIKWNAVENAIINFLKMNTKILDKRVKDMKVLDLIWFGLRVLKMLGY